jgi:hypothetical protein
MPIPFAVMARPITGPRRSGSCVTAISASPAVHDEAAATPWATRASICSTNPPVPGMSTASAKTAVATASPTRPASMGARGPARSTQRPTSVVATTIAIA